MDVDVVTGGFSYHQVDLVIPARGFDIRLERRYSTLRNFSFQDGTRFDWDERLEVDPDDNSVWHYWPDDSYERFIPNPDGSYSPAAGFITSTLARQLDGTWLLTTKFGNRHYFQSDGRLWKRADPHGNEMVFSWTPFASIWWNYPSRLSSIRDATGRVVTATWDDVNGKLTLQDWTGRRLIYTYLTDPAIPVEMRFLSYTDPEGNLYSYGYQEHDMFALSSLTLPRGRWLDLYPAGAVPLANKVGRLVLANGREIAFTYDWTNRLTTVTDGDRMETYRYDANGNITEYTDALGNLWNYQYDANDRLTRITDPRLGQVNMTWDAAGNMLTRQNQKGDTWTYEYDSRWNKVKKITGPSPLSYVQEWTYDPTTGDMLTYKDPLLKTWTYEYWPDGLLKKITDPLGHTRQFDYDEYGYLKQITNGLGKLWKFENDLVGNQTAAIDPLNNRTRRTFDRLNRVIMIRMVSPLGNTWRMGYDGNSNLVEVVDPLNRALQFEYSVMDELTRAMDPAGGGRGVHLGPLPQPGSTGRR
jgi:YD repeat-containing protein